jgi:hypothetical protein
MCGAGAGEALLAAVWANNVEEVRRLTVHRDAAVLEYRDAQVQSHPVTSNHNMLNLIESHSINTSRLITDI